MNVTTGLITIAHLIQTENLAVDLGEGNRLYKRAHRYLAVEHVVAS